MPPVNSSPLRGLDTLCNQVKSHCVLAPQAPNEQSIIIMTLAKAMNDFYSRVHSKTGSILRGTISPLAAPALMSATESTGSKPIEMIVFFNIEDIVRFSQIQSADLLSALASPQSNAIIVQCCGMPKPKLVRARIAQMHQTIEEVLTLVTPQKLVEAVERFHQTNQPTLHPVKIIQGLSSKVQSAVTSDSEEMHARVVLPDNPQTQLLPPDATHYSSALTDAGLQIRSSDMIGQAIGLFAHVERMARHYKNRLLDNTWWNESCLS